MCLAIPGKVIEIKDREVLVEYPAQTRRAMKGGIDLNLGDYVMVQMGIVVKILSEEEYTLSMSSWKDLS